MKNYLDNDLTAPKYLFHGSPNLMKIVEPKKAKDSNGNSENEDLAVFNIILFASNCLCL